MAEPYNAHQEALIAFTEQLESEIEERFGKPIRTAAIAAGPLYPNCNRQRADRIVPWSAEGEGSQRLTEIWAAVP